MFMMKAYSKMHLCQTSFEINHLAYNTNKQKYMSLICIILYWTQMVDQVDVVWVPDRACIFQDWCDNCLVGPAFY